MPDSASPSDDQESHQSRSSSQRNISLSQYKQAELAAQPEAGLNILEGFQGNRRHLLAGLITKLTRHCAQL
jgi:hypothetical protein